MDTQSQLQCRDLLPTPALPPACTLYCLRHSLRSCLHHLRCCFQADANRAGPGVTLLPSDVAQIRAAAKTKSANTARQLAERYGVTPNTIRDVWNRKSWHRAKLKHGPNRRKEQDDAA
jgi:hypothetical protein